MARAKRKPEAGPAKVPPEPAEPSPLEVLLLRQIDLLEEILARLERLEASLAEQAPGRAAQGLPPAGQGQPGWEAPHSPRMAAGREAGVTAGELTTRVIVRGIHRFDLVRQLEAALAGAPGVRRVKPLRYAVGALELEVTHHGAELSRALESLPGVGLRLTQESPEVLEAETLPARSPR